jgi:phosphatidylglycerophosphatase C
MMSNSIAFFDFDGTITHRDSFGAFLIFAVSRIKLIFIFSILSPVWVLFAFGLLSASRVKAILVFMFFKNWTIEDMRSQGSKFAKDIIPSLIRPQALDKIAWHREQGHKLVVVSASLSYWLEDWCHASGMDLICTEMEEFQGVLTGRLKTQNCFGPEKVRRIQNQYDLGGFQTIYAYGDTRGDREMLALSHQGEYRPFRG